MTRQRAKSVAMPVDCQWRVGPQAFHAGQAAPVEAGHHAGSALGRHQVGMAAHGIGLIGDVEGHHHVAPGPVAIGPDPGHDGRHPLGDRCMVGIGADLVILDEVDTGLAQCFHQIGNFAGAHTDIWLDDGAEDRAFIYAQLRPRSGNAHGRHQIARPVLLRDRERQKFQPGDFADIIEIAGNSRRQGGQIAADIGHRIGDANARAPIGAGNLLSLKVSALKAWFRNRFQFRDFQYLCTGPRAQLIGLARHLHKGAARLLTRHHCGNTRRVHRGFEQIGGFDMLIAHGKFKSPRGPGTAAAGRCRPNPLKPHGSGRTSAPLAP